MMSIKNIGILGCGWLGLPLAKAFVKDGHLVKGTTTSDNKMHLLQENSITPFLITLKEDGIEGNIDAFLNNVEVLVIDIPPKLRGENKENFVAKIKKLVPYIEKVGVKKVLFISSTTVYNDTDNQVTEDIIPKPKTEAGIQLLACETLLQNNTHFKTTVVRFAGLIGEGRNPARFLSGKTNLENPDAPINLIDLVDCIGILKKIIENEHWDQTFNAAAPFHPSREVYYTQKAIDMNLPLPIFNHNNLSIGKEISSHKIINVLDYQFEKLKL
jgi:nucleoside-diphosphate-sugar epimerase